MDYFVEVLRNEKIQLYSTQSKRVLSSFDVLKEDQEMADLIHVEVRGAKDFEQVRDTLVKAYGNLCKRQCIENAVYTQMKGFETQLQPSRQEQLSLCADLADEIMDEMLDELANDIINGKQ